MSHFVEICFSKMNIDRKNFNIFSVQQLPTAGSVICIPVFLKNFFRNRFLLYLQFTSGQDFTKFARHIQKGEIRTTTSKRTKWEPACTINFCHHYLNINFNTLLNCSKLQYKLAENYYFALMVTKHGTSWKCISIPLRGMKCIRWVSYFLR